MTKAANLAALSSGPAFSAYNSAGLSVSAATNTKMVFNVVDFDTNSNYSTSTNTFTPTVAGYYQISTSANFQSSGSPILIQLIKNGLIYAEYGRINGVGTIGGSIVAYANGTTDSFYINVYAQSGSIVGSASGRAYGWFTGTLVRAA